MHHYDRHIGDYLKDTAHLSLLEHGVYVRLMDVYYTREGGLPDAEVARLIGARSKDEKAALSVVLAEFFVLQEGLQVQARCEREIQKFLGFQTDQVSRRENEKERQRRARERRKEMFEALRQYGIVPKYDTATAELEAMLSRVTEASESRTGHAPVTPPVTRDNTATQYPVPSTQLPIKATASADRPEPSSANGAVGRSVGDTPSTFGFETVQRRLVSVGVPFGRTVRTQDTPVIREWIDLGCTEAILVAAIQHAEDAAKPLRELHVQYLDPIVKRLIFARDNPGRASDGNSAVDRDAAAQAAIEEAVRVTAAEDFR